MMKCKNCNHLGYLFDGDYVSERVWCGNIADSPDLDIERDCDHYSPMTNADRIRSMTDEELAAFCCKVKADYQWADHEFPDEDACEDWEEWLQAESEG